MTAKNWVSTASHHFPVQSFMPQADPHNIGVSSDSLIISYFPKLESVTLDKLKDSSWVRFLSWQFQGNPDKINMVLEGQEYTLMAMKKELQMGQQRLSP